MLRYIEALNPLEQDDRPTLHGVLYSDLIRHYCESVPEQHKLINPFEPKRMHVAGYKLSVGDEYYRRGKVHYLEGNKHVPHSKQRKYLEIPPFEVVIIKTEEILCLPRFLIGRWNIVVKLAYRGLLWVGGPQVDPGYVGHLFCPIYNLSEQTVMLSHRDDIALIDFVKTTPFPYAECQSKEKWIRQEYPPGRVTLEDYVKNGGIQSALYTNAALRIDNVENDLKGLGFRFATATQLTIAALAVIPAILVAMLPFANVTVSLWGPIVVGLATFAFVASAYNSFSAWIMARTRQFGSRHPKIHLVGHILSAMIAASAAIALGVETFDFAGRSTAEEMRELSARLLAREKELNEIASMDTSVGALERETALNREFLSQLRQQVDNLRALVLRSGNLEAPDAGSER